LPLYHYSFVESPRCRGITPEFSFIFLTKDQVDVTRSAVETLLPRLEGTSFELIFVDGGSTDETVPAIRAWAERYPVKLISVLPEETFNYSRNCNRGARAALGKYLLLANNDVEFHSDALVPGLRAALADPRVGVVGVSTCWRAWHRDPSWDTTEAAYLFTERPFPGFFWGMRREVYWELGALDEAFAGYGYDELDFQYRALLNHYRLALVAGGVVHRKSMTFKAVFGSSAMSVMEKFNHDVFEGKHGCGMYVSGDHVEPFARHRPPTLSIVTVASDAGSALRRSLESAIGEQRSRDGSVQWVVVDNGSSDDTALVMWEYRRRLPRLVTPLRLEQPLPAPRALAMARTRAVGRQLLVLEPGQPLPVAPAER
jgi:glycosyltransferase involved in cell wall biosynthesis